MNEQNHEDRVQEMVRNILSMANNEALLETVIAVAQESGVEKIGDLSVDEFFHLQKWKITIDMIPDLADADPSLATSVKHEIEWILTEQYREATQGED